MAAEVEGFLTQIKLATEEMRYGTVDGKVLINAEISYEEEFLPHWKEFANALEQYKYCLKCFLVSSRDSYHSDVDVHYGFASCVST